MSQSPFLGVFKTVDGQVIDMASGENVEASRIKPRMSPFLGVFKTVDGQFIDMASGENVKVSELIPNMSPFYGRFLDKDGVEHDIRDVIGGVNNSPEWKPHPDWWDIEAIVNTKTVPWLEIPLENVRYGFVVSDSNNTIKLPSGYEFYLSDGSYYNATDIITHTWDRTKDKACSDGYKTRAIIVCRSADRNVHISQRNFALDGIDSLYIYLDDCNNTNLIFNGKSILSDSNKLIKAVKIGNTTANNLVVDTLAFAFCFSLKSVVIPKGATSIGASAFDSCYSLRSVVIPESVTSIGSNAFINCFSLKSAVIPKSVTSIGNNAFTYCMVMDQIVIPESVTSIGVSAYSRCYSLKSAVIPKSVTSIGADTFSYCFSLMNVNIPENVTSIGSNAFISCYSLTSINIPKSVTSIASNAFASCYSLKSVIIPEGFNISLTLDGVNSIYLAVSAMENMIYNYADRLGTTALTLTLGATNLAKLSAEIKAVATNKNITLA